MSISTANLTTTWFKRGVSPEDQTCIDACFSKFPDEIKQVVWEQYCVIHNELGNKKANLFIQTLDDKKWSKRHYSRSKDRLAAEVNKLIQAVINTRFKAGVDVGKRFFKSKGLTPPVGKTNKSTIARMVDPDVWERKYKTAR
jgi:hypothetical protein